MTLPDPYLGEIKIITPVEDPCQFTPAWRSVIAGYFFNVNVRSPEDFESIYKHGFYQIASEDEDLQQKSIPKQDGKKKGKGKAKAGKSKAKAKVNDKNKQRYISRPLDPFFSHPEFRVYAKDPYIITQVEMMCDSLGGRRPSEKYEAFRLAQQWYMEQDHEAAIKKRIEPLLLTGIGMDVIALDLIGKPSGQQPLEVYEKLYYNCRDENFDLNKSMQLIQRFAMPYGPLRTYLRKWEEIDEDGFVVGDGRPIAKESDIWKAIAATMGYEALMYTWRWARFAHGMKDNSIEHMIDLSWNVAVSKLFSALYTGDIAHEDAARILSAFTAQAKKISDDRESRQSGGEGDTTNALLTVLRLVAPKMVEFSEKDAQARNDEIQGRIAAQLAISKTSVEDRGVQVESEIIDAQIEDTIRNDG